VSAFVATSQFGGLVASGRRITRLGVATLVLLAIGLSALLFAVTPLRGNADFVVFAAVMIVATLTVGSLIVEGRRRAVNRLAGTLVLTAFVVALLPLVLVLYYTAAKGIPHWTGTFFSHSLARVTANSSAGGIYHAIVGTAEQVGLATLISVPFGLLVAIYLHEFGRGPFAAVTRVVVDMMTGIPSIVAGLFVFTFFVDGLHAGFSGFAGSLALSILMLPIVIRASVDMIALVPDALREASYALGLTRWRTILSIVLPTASAGLTTGVMLAMARVMGETAPLLLTAFDTSYTNFNPFHGAQSALSLVVFDQAQQAYPAPVSRAWATAATLIVIVVALYVGARLLTRRKRFAPR
jgi:phosphate transport system permease protein